MHQRSVILSPYALPPGCRRVRRLARSVAIVAGLLAMSHQAGRSSSGDALGATESAISRATQWLGTVRLDPFSGGAPSFRTYTTEADTWHRLWVFETDPERRRVLERVVIERLGRVLDPEQLERLLAGPDGSTMLTEIAVLASRSREHGLDPRALREALSARRGMVLAEIGRVPPSIRALYGAYLPSAGLDPPFSLEECRRTGMLAARPREIDFGLADVYYLTHELFAYTDYAMQPLQGLPEVERTYLLRVLPFWTLFYALLNNLDVTAELVACLHAAGMRDTYAYREGIRVVLECQNPDGSFGAPSSRTLGRPAQPADFLHPTMNCLTALLLERASLRRSADPGGSH